MAVYEKAEWRKLCNTNSNNNDGDQILVIINNNNTTTTTNNSIKYLDGILTPDTWKKELEGKKRRDLIASS